MPDNDLNLADAFDYDLVPVNHIPQFVDTPGVGYTPTSTNDPIASRVAAAGTGMARGLADMLAAPGNVAQGQQPQTPGQWSDVDEAIRQANMRGESVWGPQMALTMVGQGAPAAEAGAAGIFGGRLAQTADLKALQKAQEMATAGAPREDIWNQTGWFQGADKKWRFEIPDTAASDVSRHIDIPHERAAIGDVRVGDVFQHPDLYAAYPQMRDYRFSRDPGVLFARGSYRSDELNPAIKHVAVESMMPLEEQRGTMLHELQHPIQESEGFSPGTNHLVNAPVNPEWTAWNAAQSHPLVQEYQQLHASPEYRSEVSAGNQLWRTEYQPRMLAIDKTWTRRGDTAAKEEAGVAIKQIFDDYEKAVSGTQPTVSRADAVWKQINSLGLPMTEPTRYLDPMDAYKRAAGEVEARNVTARQNLTPEQRREKPPWTTEDIPSEKQIVRLENGKQFELIPVDHDPFASRPQQERAAGGRVEGANIETEPTEAQKKAGNYAKDHVHVHGLDITIENAKGHYRRGIGSDGKPWQVKMPSHYGYIKGTVGKDRDHVDVYLGPHLHSPTAWIVDQVNADTRKFDEHKAFIGFASKQQVVETYRKAFSDGRAPERMGHLTRMDIGTFKHWLETGDMKKTADAHFPDAPRDNDKNKTTKKEADYRGGNAKRRCGICSMYVPPSGCTAVRGIISPWAVCKFFERKK